MARGLPGPRKADRVKDRAGECDATTTSYHTPLHLGDKDENKDPDAFPLLGWKASPDLECQSPERAPPQRGKGAGKQQGSGSCSLVLGSWSEQRCRAGK